MPSILSQLKRKRNSSKGRFEFFENTDVTDPRSFNLIQFPQELDYEYPNKTKAENIFICGTNSWDQYLLLSIKWRPLNSTASVCLTFTDEDVLYELKENDTINISRDGSLRKYNIAGVSIEVIVPFRKLRISVRGYVKRRDTNQLVYVRFRLFWYTLTKIYDFTHDYDDKFLANELKESNYDIKFEDRYEQYGQLKGTIQFENEQEKVIYLWGHKSKNYLTDEYNKLDSIRIFGFSCKGYAFHIGRLIFNDTLNYRYGNAYFGCGSIHAINDLTLNTNEIVSLYDDIIKRNSVKFTINIDSENRCFNAEMKIFDLISAELLLCDLKLNKKIGKTIIYREIICEDFQKIKKIPESIVAKCLGLVIPIEECQSTDVCGGKGSSLGHLFHLSQGSEVSFIVPNGVIVTFNAYDILLKECPTIESEITALEEYAWSEKHEELEMRCKNVVSMISKILLPKVIRDEIQTVLSDKFGIQMDSQLFAVRSSATGEDSEEMSAAGQMTTLLGVKGIDQICDAVMKCWASQFDYVAVEYKRGYGQLINSPMAVVIQEMVNCDSAGVMFTCDPFNGDERKIIITANYGLGESVVSAMTEPDTIKVNVEIESNSLNKPRKIKEIENINIGSKLKFIKLNNTGGTIESVNSDKNCCLKDAECIRLAETALIVHKYFNGPRDIEWGIKDGQIYLLQSRPVTNLDIYTEWELMHEVDTGQPSEREYLSRANYGEVLPGAMSELGITWFCPIIFAGIIKFFFKKVSPDMIDTTLFYNPFGCINNNAAFFNLISGSFPTPKGSNKIQKMQNRIGMFGHDIDDEELENDISERASNKSLSSKVLLNIFKYAISVHLKMEKKMKNARKFVFNCDLLKDNTFKTSKELFDHITANTCYFIYVSGKNMMYQSFYSSFYNGLILKLLADKNAENFDNLFYDFSLLLSSATDVVSCEVPNLLREIALSIENPNEFSKMSDDDALNYLKSGTSLCCEKFNEFLTKHGHRGIKEMDPLILQWGDNPIPIIKSLKQMISNDISILQPKINKSINELISSLKTPLSRTKRLILKHYLIKRCRNGVGNRENGKYLLIWIINVLRKAFWELSRMMVREGRLPEPELMFHLTYHELTRLVNERDAMIVSRARLRRRIFNKKDQLVYSEIIVGPEMKSRNENEDYGRIENGTFIKGMGICVGKIKGRACVAMNLEEAKNIRSGDILITYSTDIGWSPYFPMLSGLATEIGGLISHGAVIAREYGLPCIIGVEGAAKLFKTGDIVLLDSGSGIISKAE